MSRIAIVGSGSWGTALALSLARRGDHSIALWSHSAGVAETIRKQRKNVAYLPGFPIPPQAVSYTHLDVYKRQVIVKHRQNILRLMQGTEHGFGGSRKTCLLYTSRCV